MGMHQTASNGPIAPGVCLAQRIVSPATGCVVTTFDVVVAEPNSGDSMGTGEAHTIEHLGRAFLGNDLEWSGHAVHFGPMGSLTGFCLVLLGDWAVTDVLPLLRRMFESVAGFEGNIPGATPGRCGSFRDHDLPRARERARRFVDGTLADGIFPQMACAL